MAETKIEWCDYTWNPWRGCAEVSPGCANCYAREFARRNPDVMGTWGKDGRRVIAAESYWAKPNVWNRRALALKRRLRVFCGSMMDFFEYRSDLVNPRIRAWRVIGRNDALDWLILTKRPGWANSQMPQPAGDTRPFSQRWPHVWIGVSTENQKQADNLIPVLKGVDARIRFLSVEPLLEDIDLEPHLADGQIHWVIVGGESAQGGRCRPFELEWCESVVEQCRRHKVACFVKQVGSRPYADRQPLRMIDRKGGDMEEWPEWMRVRQFPGEVADGV